MSFSKGDSSQNTISDLTSVAAHRHSSEGSPSDRAQVASEAEKLTHRLQMYRAQLDFNCAVRCALLSLVWFSK